MKDFKIGDRITYRGFKGTVCSNKIEGKTINGNKFNCYLIHFDNGEIETKFIGTDEISSIVALNENFLSLIIS